VISEHSAGIIPFHEKSGKRTYLLLLSNLTKGVVWEFPKGLIEKGENAQSAANREFQEETGITKWEQISGFKEVLKYFYRRDSKLVAKTVTYFLAQVPSQDVTISHEARDFVWLTFAEANQRIKHKNLIKVLEHAEVFLNKP